MSDCACQRRTQRQTFCWWYITFKILRLKTSLLLSASPRGGLDLLLNVMCEVLDLLFVHNSLIVEVDVLSAVSVVE